MAKYSANDIDTLAQFFERARGRDTPFSLLTGAGCSISAGIPGAAALVEEINRDWAFCLSGLTADERRDYGKCMSCLPEEMQRTLLRPYLNGAKLNWGHIAIAGLMSRGYIGRVLTFNFDNVLARACGLVGLYPPTYDFAAAPADTFSHIGQQAIIHLHGQGHGFSMFNSEEKTRAHAERLAPLLKDIFERNSVLTIGYSGASDAVFARIKSIFSGRNSLFWAGYADEPAVHIASLLQAGGRTARYFGGADADRFLLDLARKLGCLPQLFDDPYGHLLTELQDVTDYPLIADTSRDVLADLRRKLTAARAAKATESPSIADLFRQGNWQLVLAQYDKTNAEQADYAYWSQLELADSAAETALSEATGSNISNMNHAFAAACKIKPDDIAALNNWGIALTDLGRLAAEPKRYEEAVEKFSLGAQIDPADFDLLNNWGIALSDLGGLVADAASYEEAIEKYSLAARIKPDDFNLLYNWGGALDDLAGLAADPARYEEAIEKYSLAARIKPDDFNLLNNWGIALAGLGGLAADPARYEKAIEKYSLAARIKPDDFNLLNNWGIALAGLGGLAADPARYEEAIEKYSLAARIKPDDFDLLNNWGSVLDDLGGLAANPARYEEAIEKYSLAARIKPDDFNLLNNWGIALASLGGLVADPARYEEAFEKYSLAARIKPDDFDLLNNWGTALASLGGLAADPARYEEAIEKYSLAARIKPDDFDLLNNWVSALTGLGSLAADPARYEEAANLAKRWEHLTDTPSYNLACLLAIRGDMEAAREKLLACEAAGTVPELHHLQSDRDLDGLHDLDWFIHLLARQVRPKT